MKSKVLDELIETSAKIEVRAYSPRSVLHLKEAQLIGYDDMGCLIKGKREYTGKVGKEEKIYFITNAAISHFILPENILEKLTKPVTQSKVDGEYFQSLYSKPVTQSKVDGEYFQSLYSSLPSDFEEMIKSRNFKLFSKIYKKFRGEEEEPVFIGGRGRKRFTDIEREAIALYIIGREEQRATQEKIANEIGIRRETLYDWRKKLGFKPLKLLKP